MAHHHGARTATAKGITAQRAATKRTKPKRKGGRGKHPKIEEELQNLKRKRYPDKEVTIALCNNARSDITQRLSKEELHYLRSPVESCVGSKSKMKRRMKTWLEIFDKAYFFGALRRCVKPIKIYTSYTDLRDGYWEDATKQITINTFQGQDEGVDPTEAYISTLLHECVHAFLHEYSCRCKECQKRSPSKKGGTGWTGHGATWANAMSAIEVAFQKQVRWKVDCGLKVGVLNEMQAKRWQPRAEQFARWGMDYHDVDAMSAASCEGCGGMQLVCNVM